MFARWSLYNECIHVKSEDLNSLSPSLSLSHSLTENVKLTEKCPIPLYGVCLRVCCNGVDTVNV